MSRTQRRAHPAIGLRMPVGTSLPSTTLWRGWVLSEQATSRPSRSTCTKRAAGKQRKISAMRLMLRGVFSAQRALPALFMQSAAKPSMKAGRDAAAS